MSLVTSCRRPITLSRRSETIRASCCNKA
ncbi:MAG: hypothetical protein E6Q98_09495 [Rhodospirillaceae bacterium]|nr:MAG: hypothetical protein E6Q98_09495 [Rhodospirillaceae bacterium]